MSRASCRPANGPTRAGQEKYTTEVVLQRFRGELTMLDSRGGGGGGEASAGESEEPAFSGGGRSAGGRAPAPSGGGDLDDDIPF